jgi:hypothetical protein
MVESLVLVEGTSVSQDALRSLSRRNAKPLPDGRFGDKGSVLHVAATTSADLAQAVPTFRKLPA